MPLNAVDPGNFIEPRFYATDPTIERLAALLQARSRGKCQYQCQALTPTRSAKMDENREES